MLPILLVPIIAAAWYAMKNRGSPSDANTAAFLALIRHSEGTDIYPDPWGVIYGGAEFSDRSCHPFESYNGRAPLFAPIPVGGNVTTASGAYQITLSTWNDFGGTAHYGDFSDSAQDQCAADIIASRDTQGYVASGDSTSAQRELAGTWASFTPSRLAANNAAFAAALGSA